MGSHSFLALDRADQSEPALPCSPGMEKCRVGSKEGNESGMTQNDWRTKLVLSVHAAVP